MNLTKKQNQAGFTLIELLIVVAILGLLAAIGIPQYQGYQSQAKINATKALHTEMVKQIGAEFAKCTSGATNILEGDAASVACSDTMANIAGAFATSGSAASNNPYDPAAAVYTTTSASCANIDGATCLIVSGNSIAVTTYWDGGSQSATLTKE